MVALNCLSPAFIASNDATDSSTPPSQGQLESRHDATLVRRFNDGDTDAFTEIVTRHKAKMVAVAFARLRNQDDAEEIAQDTFIRAHRALANFRGDSSLATWLHRITVNLALNRYWYFFRRCRHLSLSVDRPMGEDTTATLGDVLASDEPGPVREAMTQELTDLITDCMDRLDAGHREILRLRTVFNQSYDQIASTLQLNVGTVKSRIARARHSLQLLMMKACPDMAAGASTHDLLGAFRGPSPERSGS